MTNSDTVVDIFKIVTPQSGKFFSFKTIGDAVQGTYIGSRPGIDSFGAEQIIYFLLDTDRNIWNLGFRKTNIIIHERMAMCRHGDIVGFKFDSEKENKKVPGGKMIKIINIYADPKLVDHEWLKRQKELEEDYSRQAVHTPPSEDSDFEQDASEENSFTAPENVEAAGGNLPHESHPSNEALDAIRNLAKTKGLTKDATTIEDADKKIEEYAGLSLVEENFTKIIIKLTNYTDF